MAGNLGKTRAIRIELKMEISNGTKRQRVIIRYTLEKLQLVWCLRTHLCEVKSNLSLAALVIATQPYKFILQLLLLLVLL